jgi:uncharacterized membrane protein YqjE
MLDSLRGLAQTLVGAVRTRLQLVANELEEQGTRIAQMAALWALAGFCLALAIVLGSVLLVVLFWDSHRVEVLAFLTGLFAAGGIGAAIAARALARSRPKAFSSTLAELAADQDSLAAKTAAPKP